MAEINLGFPFLLRYNVFPPLFDPFTFHMFDNHVFNYCHLFVLLCKLDIHLLYKEQIEANN
jgi:hypothetical protein